jgi:hypothetical protein
MPLQEGLTRRQEGPGAAQSTGVAPSGNQDGFVEFVSDPPSTVAGVAIAPPPLQPPGSAGAPPPSESSPEPVRLRPGEPPSGRMTVEGRVVAVKRVESDAWGSYIGMTVRLRNGVSVWSSIPRSLDEAVELEPEALRGRRVRFTATFEPSHRDPHHAFARRPRDAELR